MGDKREVIFSTLSSDFVSNSANRIHYGLFLDAVKEGQFLAVKVRLCCSLYTLNVHMY